MSWKDAQSCNTNAVAIEPNSTELNYACVQFVEWMSIKIGRGPANANAATEVCRTFELNCIRGHFLPFYQQFNDLHCHINVKN
jgi:hypothetical protein